MGLPGAAKRSHWGWGMRRRLCSCPPPRKESYNNLLRGRLDALMLTPAYDF